MLVSVVFPFTSASPSLSVVRRARRWWRGYCCNTGVQHLISSWNSRHSIYPDCEGYELRGAPAALCPLTLTCPAIGAKVIATAGSQRKLEVCKEFGGADYALNYRNTGWQKEVHKITGGKGVGTSYAMVSQLV